MPNDFGFPPAPDGTENGSERQPLDTGLPSLFSDYAEIRIGQMTGMICFGNHRKGHILPLQPITAPTHVLKEMAELILKQIEVLEKSRQ